MLHNSPLSNAKVLFISRENVAPPDNLMHFLAQRGLRVEATCFTLQRGKIRRYLSQATAVAALRSRIESFCPDIIVFNDENSRSGLIAILRANRISRPIVWFRGAIGGYNALSPIDRYLLRHKNLARLVVRSYAMLNNWAGSPQLRHLLDFSRIDCCPHLVVPTPADKDEIRNLRRKWGIADDDLVIGSIANARPIKNIEFAARVVSQLRRDRRIHFLYIGAHDNAFKQRLESINPGNTILTGPIQHAGHYAGVFDVFVSPTSRPGEGFGLALAEAMACGVPVVATHVGGATYLVDHAETGFLLPETITSWQQALQKLIDDEGLRQRMGAMGERRIKQRFSVEATSSEFLRILTEILIERGHELSPLRE